MFQKILLYALLVFISSCTTGDDNEFLYNFSWKDCGLEGADTQLVDKYDVRKPYEVKRSETDSSTIISYKMIDECCLRYKGAYAIKNHELEIYAENISEEVCSCYCEYSFRFEVKKDETYGKITLHGEEVGE